MRHEFLDKATMRSLDVETFRRAPGFPWYNFQGFLMDEGFRRLCEEFPPIESFELHTGLERKFGQKPHDRYYLAYEKSLYRRASESLGKGLVKHQDLPKSWQSFIKELEKSSIYRDLIRSLFGVRRFKVRYAWHMSFSGCAVSPHRDSEDKIGTHIFYFNRPEDWDPRWGGSTSVLGGKSTDRMDPAFADFGELKQIEFVGNRSFLFRNTEEAWHGVEPLNCPEGYYRRLFNVIFEFPKTARNRKSWIKRALRWGRDFSATHRPG